MSEYFPTIGLEVHAELSTATKMFCSCKNDSEETHPNVNVCPVCLAHPGTLPVPNRAAIEKVLRVGAALGSKLADYSEFDRKSYFYPDIPKGYQITQFEYPFVAGGSLAGVALTRIHLEEDTARSSHEGAESTSEVDFNRAGVPLMELVTEPVIHDAETAGRFARELQLLLRTLGASKAELAKGEMRIEANISVARIDEKENSEQVEKASDARRGQDGDGDVRTGTAKEPAGTRNKADEVFSPVLGTKVEVKNLNSFRSVERAIAYEIERQSKLLDEGGVVSQETRGWDENSQSTFRQRTKEGSADYRYFPEPDIPKLKRSEIPEWTDEALKASLPELPWERRTRYESLGLTPEQAEYLTEGAVEGSSRADFFEQVMAALEKNTAHISLAANYFVSDLAGFYAKNPDEQEFAHITPEAFAQLIRMIAENKLSSRGAKEVLLVLARSGGDPEAVAKEGGFLQVSDPETLRVMVREVLTASESVVAEYRAGKEAALQFLVGASMKASKGAGNPGLIREILLEELARG